MEFPVEFDLFNQYSYIWAKNGNRLMIKTMVLIFLLISAGQLISQEQDTTWFTQYSALKSKLDTCYNTGNAAANDFKGYLKVVNRDYPYITKEAIEECYNKAEEYRTEMNTTIASCNKLKFPRNETGGNSAAIIESLISQCKFKYDELKTGLKMMNDIYQKKQTDKIINSMIEGLIKLTIANYIPFFR